MLGRTAMFLARALARASRPGLLACAALAAPAGAQQLAALEDLGRLSLAELANLEVTSVSKSPEQLRRAPAAIYVITHDEIARSGATSLAEALRLAPNLLITQFSSSSFVAAVRGLGGAQDAQNFSNKLLVLIDGRSVYSPLFSGVYFDAQDVVLDDVERIEVISGPGATLWGANAMNGVVNVITRPAYATEGTLVEAGGGNLGSDVAARYGGRTASGTSYRFYGKAYSSAELERADRSGADDAWYRGQAGARFDWERDADSVTAQADAYRGVQDQGATGKGVIEGANVLARWRHRGAMGETQLQAYLDQTQRTAPADGVAFVLHTWDVEFQQTMSLARSQQLVWGAGMRLNDYAIRNSATLLFMPPARQLGLANLFAQDTIPLGPALRLTMGVKFENGAFSGWQTQPDLRLAWQVGETTLLWAAGSRALRAPTPFDVDVVERIGSVNFLTGNDEFRPERVTTWEVGYRGEPLTRLSLSASLFYNDYSGLRTIEPAPAPGFLPLRWGNAMGGHSYGLTAWAKWQVLPWWRLSPGVTLLEKRLAFDAGASRLLGLAQAGNDPRSHGLLNSSMDLGRITFDATLRYVDALPSPALPSFWNLNARLAWHATDSLELSLTGLNLLRPRQFEYPPPAGEQARRGVLAEARWRR